MEMCGSAALDQAQSPGTPAEQASHSLEMHSGGATTMDNGMEKHLSVVVSHPLIYSLCRLVSICILYLMATFHCSALFASTCTNSTYKASLNSIILTD